MRIYLLGGKDGVAEKAGQALARRIPDLQVAGTHHGFFGPDENDKIVDAINRAKPHILFVGMGTPAKEPPTPMATVAPASRWWASIQSSWAGVPIPTNRSSAPLSRIRSRICGISSGVK